MCDDLIIIRSLLKTNMEILEKLTIDADLAQNEQVESLNSDSDD